jgi:hypothetical protein
MTLRHEHSKTANQIYTGDPVKPLEALQNSNKVFGFGNAGLTATLGLKLNMDAPLVTSPQSKTGLEL